MAKILKYPMPAAGAPFELKINGFCEVVHVGFDGGGVPCIWALVMPDKPEETWKYLVVTTGEEFDTREWSYIRSFQQTSSLGLLTWHLLRPTSQWNRDPN